MGRKRITWKAVALAGAFLSAGVAGSIVGSQLLDDNTPQPPKVATNMPTVREEPVVIDEARVQEYQKSDAAHAAWKKYRSTQWSDGLEVRAEALKGYIDALTALKNPWPDDLQLALVLTFSQQAENGLSDDEVVAYGQKLVDAGANINRDFKPAIQGTNPPLHHMVSAGRLAAVQHFVARGADVELPSQNGAGSYPKYDTPIMTLLYSMTFNGCEPISQSHLDMLSTLLEAGADVHARDERGDTFLRKALLLTGCAETEQTEEVRQLGYDKFTTVVNMMLPYGLNVNTPSKDGLSALDYLRKEYPEDSPYSAYAYPLIAYLEKLGEATPVPVKVKLPKLPQP